MLCRFPVPLLIVALAATAFGDVQIFDNHTDFDNARNAAGCNVLVGIEDFDTELTTTPNTVDCYPFPPGLMQGVPNPPGAPVGLLQPMDMYSSYFDPSCDLVSVGPGLIPKVKIVVGPNYFGARGNADFIDYGGYCAVGFEVIEPFSTTTGTIDVYDLSNVLLGSFHVPFPVFPTFYGVVADGDDTIGRIEFYADNNGAELSDNWELYVPEPSALALLALGGLMLLRRR